MASRAGRPLWWVTGLVLCLVVASGLVAWAVSERTYVAPTPHRTRPIVDPTGATATLERFQQAVRDRDPDAAAALAPDDRADVADRLAALVRNAQALRVTDFSVRYVDDDGAPSADGTWDAGADVTWRFRGFDTVSANAEVRVRLVNTHGRVALTGFGGGGRVSPVWLSGPVQVRRTASTLVLVAGAGEDVDRYARRAAAAVPVVRRVLPSWRRGLVVEVPASEDDLDAALDADPGTYDQIAAVTTAADGSQAPGAPVHVFVNPAVYDGLRPTGAQVVLSHEATHVATGAFRSPVPLWLLEGFADYVALRDVALPVSRSAAQVIAEVRRDGAPRTLPTDADFGTRATHLGATYESAWLACRLVAQRAGEPALVAFYRAVDRGQGVGAALRANAALTVPELTRAWRVLLSDLAK